MQQQSMSVKMARVVHQIDARGGTVEVDELDRILRGVGVVRQAADYRKKLVEYGYLMYERGNYTPSPESKKSATITITVKPSLIAEEVRLGVLGMLVGYPELIEISDVSL